MTISVAAVYIQIVYADVTMRTCVCCAVPVCVSLVYSEAGPLSVSMPGLVCLYAAQEQRALGARRQCASGRTRFRVG
jgi:hypothetical protein